MQTHQGSKLKVGDEFEITIEFCQKKARGDTSEFTPLKSPSLATIRYQKRDELVTHPIKFMLSQILRFFQSLLGYIGKLSNRVGCFDRLLD
jgi:hypothetical protein